MTRDENFKYNEGYVDAINFISSQIDILSGLYKESEILMQLKLIVSQAKHHRCDLNYITHQLIEKIEKK